jgi:hypothetical protein
LNVRHRVKNLSCPHSSKSPIPAHGTKVLVYVISQMFCRVVLSSARRNDRP